MSNPSQHSSSSSSRPPRAARNLLKNYYGISEEPPAPSPNPATSSTSSSSPQLTPAHSSTSDTVGFEHSPTDAGPSPGSAGSGFGGVSSPGSDSRNGSGGMLAVPPGHRLKSRGPNPMDMDSPFFIPETFLSKCLNENTLPEMIQKDNELVNDIKDLDSQMKTLVYGNYNKFIAAADTIRAMKSKVENMETQMLELTKSMDTITNSNMKIQDALSEKRGKTRQLVGVHSLLQKLSFIFELPGKLEECLRTKQYAEAVKLHLQTWRLLEHYQHLTLFQKIQDECRITISQVALKVKTKMLSPESTTAEIAECVGLLLGLNTQSPVELAKEFLSITKSQLLKVRSKALKQMAEVKAAPVLETPTQPPTDPSSVPPTPTNKPPSSATSPTAAPASATSASTPAPSIGPAESLVLAKLSILNSTFLSQLSDFASKYHEHFLERSMMALLSPTTTTAVGLGGVGKGGAVGGSKLSAEDREEALKEMHVVVDELVKGYFATVTDLLAIPDDIWSLNPQLVLNVLASLNNDICNMHGLIKTVQIDAKFRDFTLSFIDRLIAAAFQPPKKNLMDTILSVLTQPEETKYILDRAMSDLRTSFVEKSFPLLQRFVDAKLKYLSSSDGDAHDGVLDKMTSGFEHFWSSLGDQLKSYTHHHTDLIKNPLPKPLVLLVMSRSALDMSTSLIEPLFGAFHSAVVKRGAADTPSGSAVTPSPTSPYGTGLGGSPKRSNSKHDPRKHMVVVTATGGTVASASGPYGRKSGGIAGNEVGEPEEELTGRAAELQAKGKDVARIFKHLAQSLLVRYVLLSSDDLASKLRLYVSKEINWMSIEPPMSVNFRYERILTDMFELVHDVQLIFDDESSPDRASGGGGLHVGGGRSGRAAAAGGSGLNRPPSRASSIQYGLSNTNGHSASSTSLSALAAGTSAAVGGGGQGVATTGIRSSMRRSSSSMNVKMVGGASSSGNAGAGGAGGVNKMPKSGSGLIGSMFGGSKRGPNLDGVPAGRSSVSSSAPGMSGPGHTRTASAASAPVAVGGKTYDPLLDNIGKLFQERIEFYGPVEMSRSGIMISIIRNFIKVYIEEIRLQVLSTCGLQYVQVDMEHLLIRIQEGGYVNSNDDKGILALVEETVSSAYKRCLEAIPLDQEALDTIVRGSLDTKTKRSSRISNSASTPVDVERFSTAAESREEEEAFVIE
ncbi:Vacuolar protein sorting-associated protein 51 [Chytridiales sp. JEL 0842]|nr:Vacuolar protein sorting-associated protein 51 [Chytridiales sp. JEL 0842]